MTFGVQGDTRFCFQTILTKAKSNYSFGANLANYQKTLDIEIKNDHAKQTPKHSSPQKKDTKWDNSFFWISFFAADWPTNWCICR